MTDRSDDALLSKLMKAAGPRPVVPAELEERWAAHFAAELSGVLRQRRRRRMSWAIAAVVSVIVVGAVLRTLGPAVPSVPVAEIVLSIGNNEFSSGAPLTAGSEVRAGDELFTGTLGHVALAFGDLGLRLDSDTIVVVKGDHVVLERGSVYVDAAPGANTLLRIETSRGSVTHTGTQFVVTIDDRSLTAAVREGTIDLKSDSVSQQLSGGADGATLATLTDQGISITRVPRHGGVWNWVYVAAPAFFVDGRSAHEFLQWASRESGCSLEYIDDETRRQAEQAILSGDVSDLSLDDALEVLSATTRLNARTNEDEQAHGACVIDVTPR